MIRQKKQEPKFPTVILNKASDNLVYASSFYRDMRELNQWNEETGRNLLDGGAPFY